MNAVVIQKVIFVSNWWSRLGYSPTLFLLRGRSIWMSYKTIIASYINNETDTGVSDRGCEVNHRRVYLAAQNGGQNKKCRLFPAEPKATTHQDGKVWELTFPDPNSVSLKQYWSKEPSCQVLSIILKSYSLQGIVSCLTYSLLVYRRAALLPIWGPVITYLSTQYTQKVRYAVFQ